MKISSEFVFFKIRGLKLFMPDRQFAGKIPCFIHSASKDFAAKQSFLIACSWGISFTHMVGGGLGCGCHLLVTIRAQRLKNFNLA